MKKIILCILIIIFSFFFIVPSRAEVLFYDNFESYADIDALNSSANWDYTIEGRDGGMEMSTEWASDGSQSVRVWNLWTHQETQREELILDNKWYNNDRNFCTGEGIVYGTSWTSWIKEADDIPTQPASYLQIHPDNNYVCKNAPEWGGTYNNDGYWEILSKWETDTSEPCSNDGENQWSNLMAQTPGMYHFVVRWKANYDGTGELDVWINGVQVVNYDGPCAQRDGCGSYLKHGMYHYNHGSNTPDNDFAQIFIDEFRIGLWDNYAEFAPQIRPSAPGTIVYPLNGSTGISTSFVVDYPSYSDSFTDPTGTYSHYAIRVVIDDDSDFSSPVVDQTSTSGYGGDLTKLYVTGLSAGTYYIKSYYQSWAGDVDKDGDGVTALTDSDDRYWSIASASTTFEVGEEDDPSTRGAYR